MKVRYTIEHGTARDASLGRPVFLATIDSAGEYVVGPVGYPTIDAAKAAAAKEEPDLTWKNAPQDWQPDTILVSNYWNDEGWDNR